MGYEEIDLQMRAREASYEQHISNNEWIVARLDGRNFSSLTEQCYEKPFDLQFHTAMLQTAEHVLAEFSGVYAYVASDEISLLFEPSWTNFDRRVEKSTTLIASSASVHFSIVTRHPSTFDTRILSFAEIADVYKYFTWRLNDVERCALQTLTYWILRKQGHMTPRQATKRLEKATVSDKVEILASYGIDYARIPKWETLGAGLYWETYEKQGYNPVTKETVTATRRRISCFRFDDSSPQGNYQTWLTARLSNITK